MLISVDNTDVADDSDYNDAYNDDDQNDDHYFLL